MALDRDFVRSINDWIRWYNYHRKSAENAGVVKKLEFLEKAVRGLFYVTAAMADELDRVDSGERTSKHLILPTGVKIGG